MACARCGGALPEGGKFCPACGAAAGPRRLRPNLGRLAACALFIYAAAYNGAQIGSLAVPGFSPGKPMRWITSPANGMHLAATVLSMVLAAACLGRVFLDRLLEKRRRVAAVAGVALSTLGILTVLQLEQRWPGFVLLGLAIAAFAVLRAPPRYLPILVAFVAMAAFGGRVVLSTSWHREPIEAARAFDTEVIGDSVATGSILFAPAQEGGTHMARITPDLVRALDQRSRSANRLLKERECTLPGFSPILLLLLLAAIGGLNPELRRRALPPWILGVHLYMTVWWSVSQTGFVTSELGLHAPVACFAIFIAGLALASGLILRRGIDRSWDGPAGESWVAAAHMPMLILVSGIALVTFKSPGSPVFLWLMLYVGAGALCWTASRTVAKVKAC
jgi:hypothetical protein